MKTQKLIVPAVILFFVLVSACAYFTCINAWWMVAK